MAETRKYLQQIKTSVAQQNGRLLSTHLGLSSNKLLDNELKNNGQQAIVTLQNSQNPIAKIDAKLNKFIMSHLQFRLHNLLGEYSAGFEALSSGSKIFIEFWVEGEKPDWISPVFSLITKQLRGIAKLADKDQPKPTYLEKCVFDFREFYKVFSTSRHNLIMITNSLFRVHFTMKTYQGCSTFVLDRQKSIDWDSILMSQRVTYHFYSGCLLIFEHDLQKSLEKLSFAFENIPYKYFRSKRLALSFLIPLQLLKGSIPSKKLLEKYKLLNIYGDIIEAFTKGDVGALHLLIEERKSYFIVQGTYLVIQKLQLLAYRNLFKRVYLILSPVPNNVIFLDSFVKAARFINMDICEDELECLMANLIYRGYVRGYIAKRETSCVKFGSNPFPKLSEVFPKMK